MQQPGGGGGSQYRMSPDMADMFGIPAAAEHLQQPAQPQLVIQQKSGEPEAASPISSRPPPARNFEELVPAGGGGFPDEEALVGEEAERGPPGNRWPRQETLALLKIRSDMDAAFRDATLKGPLWEEVSRKLGELGYQRSAKKCKEKFENVHKYYKRTKEGRAGRQDGKSYRFFSQLEALHSGAASGSGEASNVAPVSATPISVGNPMTGRPQVAAPRPPPLPISSTPPSQFTGSGAGGMGGINFSSSSSEGEEDSEEEVMEEGRPGGEARKRKRSGSGGGGSSSKKMMAFFEGLIRQVMERQESMQQRFLETIEKREQDRMIREEAWKRQEMARLNREHELMAQERATAASRDAAVIGFLQKITGQTIQLPTSTTSAAATIVSIPTAPPLASQPVPQPYHTLHHHQQHPPQKPQQQVQSNEASSGARRHPPATSTAEAAVVAILDHQNQQDQPDPTSSRWPKPEVHALIKLRSGLESRYQESGPKGPLWEEISAGMQRMGYQRSSKRCKEKWENINKYFKKVKESNKKRPEDAKTCPYFHQLDALYKKKMVGSSSNSGSAPAGGQVREDQGGMDQNVSAPIVPASMPQSQSDQSEAKDNKNNNNGRGKDGSNNGGSNLQEQTSNGGLPSSFFDQGAIKKPEDIMKELMMEHRQQSVMDDYDKLGEPDSDNLEQDVDDEDEDDEDNDEDAKMDYKIQYQRPGPGSSNGGGNVAASTAATAGSFLAVVQ